MRAPLGTLLVMVWAQGGPSWHSVSDGFGSGRAPLSDGFGSGRAPLSTPLVTVLDQGGSAPLGTPYGAIKDDNYDVSARARLPAEYCVGVVSGSGKFLD